MGNSKNRKRKQQNTEDFVQLSNGIQLGRTADSQEKTWLYLLTKGAVVFLLVIGTVGGFLSAIQVEYNELMFMAVIFLTSVYISLIYYRPLFRDLGYVVFFGIFLTIVLKYRMYINSGFYAVINEVTQIVVKYYDLPGANEYSEFVADRYTTITAAACFIGAVEALLLNINVLKKMRVLGSVVLSAIVFFLPVYLNKEPDMFFVFCMVAGQGCVLLFRTGDHYKTVMSGKKKHRAKRNKQKYISYDRSAKISLQTLVLAAMAGIFCIWSAGVFIPKSEFENTKVESGFKLAMDAAVLDIWENGIDGLFRDKTAAGGISRGKLGRNAAVQPDYQTDLIVTFTPYSMDTIYLKAYTGIVYGDNQWENDIPLSEIMYTQVRGLQQQYESGKNEWSAKGIMKVENVDADADFLYYPYYTFFEDDENYMETAGRGLAVGQENSYIYYPLIRQDMGETFEASTLDDIYLDVPEKNRDVVAAFCKEMNLSGSKREKINQVIEYFQDNIPYTVRPGAVPKGEDSINYFLSKNKKGYCAHFASAAVLIFRYLGIPARYVEGYAVNYGQVIEGDVLSENYSDYYDGYSRLGETAVVQVEVSDASAHAWVEVYDEQCGWVCVDVTPSTEEETTAGNFWNFFGNLLSAGEDAEQMQNQEKNHGGGIFVDFLRAIYVLGGLIIVFVLLCAVRIGKKIRFCYTGDEKQQTIAEYHLLCQTVRAARKEFNSCFSHKEQLEWIQKQFSLKTKDLEETAEILECISYSEKKIEKELLKQEKAKLQSLRKQIMHGCTVKERRNIFRYWIGKAC